MSDTERRSVEQLFDQSEEYETGWPRFAERDAAERGKLIEELTAFVRLCAQNGIFIPPGSADRRALRSILDRWSSRLRDAGVNLANEGLLAAFDPKAGVVLEVPCPYPGLDAYSAARRGSFFGRENEIAKAVQHLDAAGNRILMILGSSGSGKSSLALAGILPRLKDEHEGAWLFAQPFTPGAEPVAALAGAVADAAGKPESAPGIRRSLAEAPEQAHAGLASVCGGRPLMLLIDQFEELLTLCHDPDEQGRFARILCALSDPLAVAGGFMTRILLTLRTDHQDRFARSDALVPLHRRLVGEHNSDQLSAIGFAEIRRAIKEPADSVGLRFVPTELVDRLASQTAGLANGLPLLQFALQRLWETRPRNAGGQRLDLITQEMVDGLPDVQGALGKVAEGLFEALTGPEQRACERLLLELVVLDENFEEPLRRRRSETEVIGAMERSGHAAADIGKVVGDFVDQHLVRRFGEPPDNQLEVAHEALLRNWPHIRDILLRSKERLHLVKAIGREAAEWVDGGRTDDELRLHGDRLARAVAYARDGWLVDMTASNYIAACRKREAANRWRDRLVRIAALVFVALIPLAVLVWRELSTAQERINTAQERNRQLEATAKAFDAMTELSNTLVFDVVKDVDLRDSLPPNKVAKIFNSTSKAYGLIIEHDPQSAGGYNGRGSTFLLTKGETGRAIEDFDRAIRLDPGNASYYSNLGTAYRIDGDLDRAINNYDKAIKIDPQFSEAWLGRCFALTRKAGREDLEQALKACNEALRLDPDNTSTLVARGYTGTELARRELEAGPTPAREQGSTLDRLDQAIADLTKAIELNPKSFNAYGNRGEAYRLKGELDPAINDFDRAIALNPQHAESYFSRGLAWRSKGYLGQAITDYSAALKLDRNFDKARRARCFARAIAGSLDAALADCTQSLKLNPKIAGTYDSRGLIYLKLGQFDNAIADYDVALGLKPNHAGARYGRGLAKLKAGDPGGNADIAAAKAITPEIVAYFASYGVQ